MRKMASVGAGLLTGLIWFALGSALNVFMYYLAAWQDSPEYVYVFSRDFLGPALGAYFAVRIVAHFSKTLRPNYVFGGFALFAIWWGLKYIEGEYIAHVVDAPDSAAWWRAVWRECTSTLSGLLVVWFTTRGLWRTDPAPEASATTQ